MRKPFLILLLLVACLIPAARSQAPIVATPVGSVPLPWGLSNLSVIDSTLYACQNGVLVSAPTTAPAITALLPDTIVGRLCPEAVYVVRNSRDSLLYFSTGSEQAMNTSLNVHTNARLFKNRRVEVKSWYRDICHPVFSPDGNAMVFSSKGKVGLGGYDLWYSHWNGSRWSSPINLGNTINTQGNEISPVFYGGYLVFASDGMPGAPEGFNLYAVRIKSGAKADDIIFDSYVVQPLPEPINSNGDDWEMAFDPDGDGGYWLSTRNGKEQLFTFTGDLDGVMLTGHVVDEHQRPVSAADIRLLRQGRLVASATSDSAGAYHLFALPDNDYRLLVTRQDYYNYNKTVSLVRPSEHLLIASQTADITLSRLPFGRVMVFDNLFQEDGDVELTASARQSLQPIVDYLRDNGNVLAQFTLYCSQEDDASYREMIIARRISNIQRYVESCLPSGAQISYKDGWKNDIINAQGMQGNAVCVELFPKE